MTGLGDGAYVTHKGTVNDGIRMTVKDVDTDKDEVLCILSDGTEQWIPLDQLDLNTAAPNGIDL